MIETMLAPTMNALPPVNTLELPAPAPEMIAAINDIGAAVMAENVIASVNFNVGQVNIPNNLNFSIDKSKVVSSLPAGVETNDPNVQIEGGMSLSEMFDLKKDVFNKADKLYAPDHVSSYMDRVMFDLAKDLEGDGEEKATK